jgi:hypothetical protein
MTKYKIVLKVVVTRIIFNKRKEKHVKVIGHSFYQIIMVFLNIRKRKKLRDKRIPVTTAWRVLRLRVDERPPI